MTFDKLVIPLGNRLEQVGQTSFAVGLIPNNFPIQPGSDELILSKQ